MAGFVDVIALMSRAKTVNVNFDSLFASVIKSVVRFIGGLGLSPRSFYCKLIESLASFLSKIRLVQQTRA